MDFPPVLGWSVEVDGGVSGGGRSCSCGSGGKGGSLDSSGGEARVAAGRGMRVNIPGYQWFRLSACRWRLDFLVNSSLQDAHVNLDARAGSVGWGWASFSCLFRFVLSEKFFLQSGNGQVCLILVEPG